jgi:hypothetical protein
LKDIFQIRRQKIPLEHPHAVIDPRILTRVVFPEMMVRVDSLATPETLRARFNQAA